MKRDLKLIRELLLEFEKNALPFINATNFDLILRRNDKLNKIDKSIIYAHIILLNDAKLLIVDLVDLKKVANDLYYLTELRITWEGYELLDLIRDENIFNQILQKTDLINGFTLPLIKDLASTLIKNFLCP